MADEVSNLIIEHLKALRADVAAVKADTMEIKERLRSHDASIIELRRADVHVFEDQARQQVSIDALARRVERLEHRLELT
jgi:hypothetical protein